VTDETNYEASDLLFLNCQRFSEEIEVNLVELPVMVTDASGVPVTDLKEADFSVFENGKHRRSHRSTTLRTCPSLPAC